MSYGNYDELNMWILTFGTCGLNSTALCIASTALISAADNPLLVATSKENLSHTARALSNAAV